MIKYLNSEEETEQFGAELWGFVQEKSLIYLIGQLGAGKTTLVRGFLRAAGFSGVVKSPTFTLVEEYYINNQKIVHFDLYRLSDPEELEWIGIQDYFDGNCLCFVEWPDKGKGYLAAPDFIITFKNEGVGRLLTVETN